MPSSCHAAGMDEVACKMTKQCAWNGKECTDAILTHTIGLNQWDTSKSTSMNGMFYGARSFNAKIDEWQTGQVKNFAEMFRDAVEFNGPIGAWNTESAETMEEMFRGAESFAGEIDQWVTKSVTTMKGMFRDAHSFNGEISGWNTENVVTTAEMLMFADSFEKTAAWPLEKLSNVEDNMAGMFYGCCINISFDVKREDCKMLRKKYTQSAMLPT